MKTTNLFALSLVSLACAGLAIQLVPVQRSNPPVLADLQAPAEVKAILKTSCYDCHSNESVWPWYSRVAPVSWLVASDVARGRRHFNFSTWDSYDAKKQQRILARTVREVERGDMPPWYYTIKHGDAKLTPAQRALLLAWAAQNK